MEISTIDGSSLSRRVALLAAGIAAAVLMYVGILSGSVPQASAAAFCSPVTLAPYGSYGDRCYAWEWEAMYRLLSVSMATNERAGCVTYAAPNTYDLQDSWLCAGKYSSATKYVRDDEQTHRGVIRNNNLTYAGKFSGAQNCCWY